MTTLCSASSLTLDQDAGTGQGDVTRRAMGAFPTMAAGSMLIVGPTSFLWRPFHTVTTSTISVTTPAVRTPYIWTLSPRQKIDGDRQSAADNNAK